MLEVQVWFELYRPPSGREAELLEEVLASWFMLGRLGAFNAQNLQVCFQHACSTLAVSYIQPVRHLPWHYMRLNDEALVSEHGTHEMLRSLSTARLKKGSNRQHFADVRLIHIIARHCSEATRLALHIASSL